MQVDARKRKFRDISAGYTKNPTGLRKARRTGGIVPRNIRRSAYYGRRRVGELKFFDTAVASTPLGTAGTIYSTSLNLVTQGSGENQMVGRKINIKRVSLNMRVTKDDSANATLGSVVAGDTLRFYLILDKQCNGTQATIAQIFETGTGNSIVNFMELSNKSRFQILKEWIVPIQSDVTYNATGAVYASGQIDQFYKWSEAFNIPIEYLPEATPGTRDITEIRTNNLLLCGFSVRGLMEVQMRCRIRYSDN